VVTVAVLRIDRCEEGGAKYYIDISPFNQSGDPEMSTATIVTELLADDKMVRIAAMMLTSQ